jgi:hypothetical protein
MIWYKVINQIKEENENFKAKTRQELKNGINVLIGYPIIIAIVWSLSTAQDTLITLFPGRQISNYYIMKCIANIFPCSQGFFIGIYFFKSQTDIRIDFIDCINFYIRTGTWKQMIEQSTRRRRSSFSQRVYIDSVDGYRAQSVQSISYRSNDMQDEEPTIYIRQISNKESRVIENSEIKQTILEELTETVTLGDDP